MTKKRRRQIQLISEVLFYLLVIGFCVVVLTTFVYRAVTPEMHTQSLSTVLEPLIGYDATLIFFIVFFVLTILVAVLLMLRALRLLRAPAALEREFKQPSIEDFM